MVSLERVTDTAPAAPAAPAPGRAGALAGRIDRALGSVRFLMVASGGAFILVVNALIGYGVWQQHDKVTRDARRSTQHLARILEDHTVHTLRAADQLFAELHTVLDIRPEARQRAAKPIFEYLRGRRDAFEQIVDIVVVGENGTVQHHSANTEPPGFDLNDRDYVAAHRARTDSGLFIGAPMESRAFPGTSVIPLSRRMDRPDGGFGGVMAILLDPHYLNSYFDKMRLGQGAAVLAQRDGTVLARQPAADAAPDPEGKQIGGTPIGARLGDWPELAALVTAGDEGTDVIAAGDGTEHIVSFRKSKDYPLVIAASVPARTVLADWKRDTAAWSFIGISMTGAIVLLTGFVVGQHRKREQDQAKLAQASQRIRGILESMVDAVLTIDSRGRIETFNPAAEAMFGYPEAEIVGKSIDLLIPEPFRSHHGRWLADYKPGKGSRIIGNDREVMALRRDGGTFPMNLAISELVVGADVGARRVFVGVIRDITARKQKEAEVLAAKSQAEMANRAKSEFLANMSHELRTPLNAIIGFSEILDSEFFGKLNERQKSCAKDIHDSGKHLLDIVNAVLDMSKIESGRYELVEEIIDPAESVAHSLMMIRERAQEAGIELRNAVGGPLPYARADRRAFKQVILNLLSNAVKFTPAGGRVTVEARVEEDGGLAVSVADTGIGIPAAFMEHLFQPFRQADNSASRQYEGTGLGLSISKNFMELHGGTLSCRSEVGVGTVMTARLPAGRIITPGEKGAA